MSSSETASETRQLNTISVLAIALAVVVVSRGLFVIWTDFPVNDGGLFVQFIREVAETFPGLPSEVRYNGLTLPFAYPPLSFWLGALLTKIGFSSIGVVRVMPVVLNLCYVLLFAVLLLKSGRTQLFTGLAILFMTVTLRSSEWLLMGGGVSRGLGAVFLVITLIAIKIPEVGPRRNVSLSRSAVAGAMAGAAILSHLEWGILAAGSILLSRLLGSTTIKGFLLSTAVAGAAAAAVVLPWLIFVYASHGLQPFLSAGGTSRWGLESSAQILVDFAISRGWAIPISS